MMCKRCKGSGMLEAQLKNLATLDYDWAIIGCDDCRGKGDHDDEPGRVYAPTSYRNERPYGEPIAREKP
jgi:DnaJ-class molecular chaperone